MMLRAVTVAEIKEMGACDEAVGWAGRKFPDGKAGTVLDCLTKAPKDDALDWALWLLAKTDRPLCVSVLCDFAERVLPIFEKKYPADKRPQNCIEACREWVANPTPESEKKMDAAAARAAWAVQPVEAAWAAAAAQAARAAGAAAAAWVAWAARAAEAAEAAEAARAARAAERRWQREHLEEVLREASNG